jgi:arylsulfatase A-like enzyme
MSGPRKPNVLLITADQFRADALSCAGHKLVKTPNLDRLAEDGVRFSLHFSQCPPCGPSRTSLLTGMYQMNHRSVVNGAPLDAAFTNVAEQARTAGYTPWLIGYTDTTLDPRRLHPNDPRAGRYEEVLPGLQQFSPGSDDASTDPGWLADLRGQGYEHWQTPFRQKPGFEAAAQAKGPTYAPCIVKSEHGLSAYAANQALRFFRQYAQESWFLHLSFQRPHPPFIAAEPYHDLYKLEDVPDFVCQATREAEAATHPFLPYRLDRLEMNPKLPLDGRHPNDNPAWRQARATYYGLITELDDQIGRLIAALKDQGAYDDTLIVFTSDHGEMLGDHYCWGKGTYFDQAVRVPLIVKAPHAASRGLVIEEFSEHVDVMPTILDWLGVEKPLQCDGHSLRPFLEGGKPSRWRDETRWEFDFRDVSDDAAERLFGITLDECGLAVLRTATEKYVHFSGLPPLFYDLATDPDELRNLIPQFDGRVLALAQRMLNWRMVYNRRELTGIRIHDGQQSHADRARRIT